MDAATQPAIRGRHRWVRHGMSNRRIYQGLASGCARLPLSLLHAISTVSNAIAVTLMRGTLAEVSSNYRLALGLDPRAARGMARRLFFQYGLTTIDLFRTRAAGSAKLPELGRHPRDDRILTDACRGGRGCLVVTGHLGNWELGGIYLALHGFPVTLIGQPELDPDVQALRDEIRSRFGIGWIEIGSSTATAIRVREAVDRGRLVAFLVDRAYPEDRIQVELFGRPTDFIRSPALLARFCTCPIVPSYLFRQRDGSYRSYFGDPLETDASARPESEERRVMSGVAEILERGIREEPTQWFNFYDYWGRSASGRSAEIPGPDGPR